MSGDTRIVCHLLAGSNALGWWVERHHDEAWATAHALYDVHHEPVYVRERRAMSGDNIGGP